MRAPHSRADGKRWQVGALSSRALHAFVGLAAMAAGGVASAQLVPKQQVLDEYGACVVRLAPEASDRLSRTPLGSETERSLAFSLSRAQSGCLRGRAGLSMQTGAIRGAVAKAMLARDATLMEAARKLSPLPATPPVATAEGRAFVIGYAECLARADPARTLALIATPYASATERTAFLAFGDAVKACMPQGTQYNVDMPDVRNHLASVLYLSVTSQAAR